MEAKIASAREWMETHGLSQEAVREREHREVCPTCIRDRELGRIKTVLANLQAENAEPEQKVSRIKARKTA